MSGSRLNQGSDLDQIVNKRNKWLFSSLEISRYLVKSDNSVLIPRGNVWHLAIQAYPGYIYNLLKLTYFLAKQLFSFRKTSFHKKSTHILLSTGSGYDLKNYSKFFRESNVEVIQLEAFNINQFTNFNIVKIKTLIAFFVENLQEVSKILRLKLPQDLRDKIVNQSFRNLASYTYFCAFLFVIKKELPKVKIFHSGAYLLSVAATRVGIETFYLLHGLAGKVSKVSFPFFDHIYVYSSEDKIYFENVSPKSNVCLYPLKELSNLEKRVIIFLRQSDFMMSEVDLSELLSHFSKKDFKIFFKKHPAYQGSLAEKLAKKHNVEIIDLEKDGSGIILNYRPSFTVSWMSTSLCESLNHGVIPISLASQEEPKYAIGHINPEMDMSMTWIDKYAWTPYPIKKRSLSWRDEKARIYGLLEDISLYRNTLSELRTR